MMKILISSSLFYPSLGGSETDAEIFAREFTRLGHVIKVITRIPGTNIAADSSEFPFEVIRQPSPIQLLKLVHWCDVYFHNGIILKDALPLLIIPRPWIVRHQSWIRSIDGTLTGIGGNSSSWRVRLKHFFVRFSVSISISQAIANHLRYPSTVIPNPYRDNLFRVIPDSARTKDLVFLGRLVSEKGVGVLLEALGKLKQWELKPQLTIIGKGPEEPKLRQQVIDLEITEQVTFVGAKVGEELVNFLNKHQIMVVSSLYDEPFGVVALEGIACGCVVVGSEGGGLKDAIGSCGVTFPNGDVNALTQTLFDLLSNPKKLDIYRGNAEFHLSRHKQAEVAKAYLQVIEAALQ
ncbi:MAG: glycosyltransferase family 4 protein [Coleofasciculus sp. G1-WW12-02]|uniref:glycosyltransferase family 4 protein n=1 Tax=Coleofasciculus sp. G1-WW12-02 TaxID=3068483 RepID=UPI003303F5B7